MAEEVCPFNVAKLYRISKYSGNYTTTKVVKHWQFILLFVFVSWVCMHECGKYSMFSYAKNALSIVLMSSSGSEYVELGEFVFMLLVPEKKSVQ